MPTLTPDEITAHMRTITDFCNKTLKLQLSQAAEILFSLAIQMNYAQCENETEVRECLVVDSGTLYDLAWQSYRNNNFKTGAGVELPYPRLPDLPGDLCATCGNFGVRTVMRGLIKAMQCSVCKTFAECN